MTGPAIRVAVQREPFDAGTLIAALGQDGVGGIASFIGTVRGGGGLVALELEHHPRLTERGMQRLADEAATRWSLAAVSVVHRHGRIEPGGPIVFVGAAAAHRAAALDAVAFLIDRLKTEALFWKREHFGDGSAHWIDARAADDARAARWG